MLEEADKSVGAWPCGDGELARRIRVHDWAETPLGPIESWPQSLRTMVDAVLAMPGPAIIMWGPEHVQLYNDAYIAIAQDRHPALLGRPAAEGWSEAYEAVGAPLLEDALTGRSARLADFAVELRGPDGIAEERAFDFDLSPIRDETGAVAGVLQILVEVTDRQRSAARLRESEARQAFLLRFSDALREETDADAIANRAISMLAEQLKLDRCYITLLPPGR